VGDRIEDEDSMASDEAALHKFLKADMEAVLRTLSEKEAGVVRLRFGLLDGTEKTLEECGKYFGVGGASLVALVCAEEPSWRGAGARRRSSCRVAAALRLRGGGGGGELGRPPAQLAAWAVPVSPSPAAFSRRQCRAVH
jgi:hypothetical protein